MIWTRSQISDNQRLLIGYSYSELYCLTAIGGSGKSRSLQKHTYAYVFKVVPLDAAMNCPYTFIRNQISNPKNDVVPTVQIYKDNVDLTLGLVGR